MRATAIAIASFAAGAFSTALAIAPSRPSYVTCVCATPAPSKQPDKLELLLAHQDTQRQAALVR